MKSNAQLQRFQEPDEPVLPAPAEPSAASSSHSVPPSDAVMGMLTQITDQLQSMNTQMTEGFRSMDYRFQAMDTRMIEGFQSVDDRFQGLEAKVAQIQINVWNTLCYMITEDQRDQVP
jgi:uncharacterized coiled-coil protein SlyX